MSDSLTGREAARLQWLRNQLDREGFIAGRELTELALLTTADPAALAIYRALPADHGSKCCCSVCDDA